MSVIVKLDHCHQVQQLKALSDTVCWRRRSTTCASQFQPLYTIALHIFDDLLIPLISLQLRLHELFWVCEISKTSKMGSAMVRTKNQNQEPHDIIILYYIILCFQFAFVLISVNLSFYNLMLFYFNKFLCI